MYAMDTCLSNSYIPRHLTSGMEGKKELQEMAEKATAPDFKLTECTLEHNGDVTCSVSKEVFANVSESGVKPNRLVFEIKD